MHICIFCGPFKLIFHLKDLCIPNSLSMTSTFPDAFVLYTYFSTPFAREPRSRTIFIIKYKQYIQAIEKLMKLVETISSKSSSFLTRDSSSERNKSIRRKAHDCKPEKAREMYRVTKESYLTQRVACMIRRS